MAGQDSLQLASTDSVDTEKTVPGETAKIRSDPVHTFWLARAWTKVRDKVCNKGRDVHPPLTAVDRSLIHL